MRFGKINSLWTIDSAHLLKYRFFYGISPNMLNIPAISISFGYVQIMRER